MSYVITGATGHFGRHVVESLLDRGVAADNIVATGRTISRIDHLAERGVQTRASDYDDPESLRAAFAGAEKVLLVSGSEVGRRVQQHRNVIKEAVAAGARLLAYTSISNADRTDILLAADHQATEQILANSGVPFTLLRNNLYIDNYTGQLPTYLEHGAVLGSADDGRLSAATRSDLAEAAAAVLASGDQPDQVYELGGDEAFTYSELAATISEASGRPVVYRDLPVEEYTKVLVGAGLPQSYAAVLADADRGIAEGQLYVTSGDLSRLLGRRTTSMPDAVRAALSSADPVG
jgi:NAD(P)H dehydrogenase (quinone)